MFEWAGMIRQLVCTSKLDPKGGKEELQHPALVFQRKIGKAVTTYAELNWVRFKKSWTGAQGDSGGPAFIKTPRGPQLVGVTSLGAYKYLAFMNVAEYSAFIESTLAYFESPEVSGYNLVKNDGSVEQLEIKAMPKNLKQCSRPVGSRMLRKFAFWKHKVNEKEFTQDK